MQTVFILQARVVYQRELEGSVQYLCCCLLWTEILDVIPRICRSYSPSLGVTALSASIVTGTTVAFTLHSFSTSSLSPWYFSNFSCSFSLTLLSRGIAFYHYSRLPLLFHQMTSRYRRTNFQTDQEVPQDLSSVILNQSGGHIAF